MQSPWPVVRRALRRRQLRKLSDHELLAIFLDERAEEAFAVLVGRHGPMVLGVCRRILFHVQDAEDAFQAVFLVLVRKAASIAKRDALSAWLYGVAYRIALRAKRMKARRRSKEGEMGMARSEVNHTPSWTDLEPLLDLEVSRLPKKYQVPLVLCELEGKSRKDAARLLGLPEGTLSSRLSRARELLRERFRRRGVTISAVALSAALLQNASAAVPPDLACSAVKAALSFELGMVTGGTLSANVTALAQTGLKSLLLQKISLAVAALIVGIGLSGAALQWSRSACDSRPEELAAAPFLADADDGDDAVACMSEEDDWTEMVDVGPTRERETVYDLPTTEELPTPALWKSPPRHCKGPWSWRIGRLGARR
ncbi:MAG: RNA polymerase sigma factor [Gemmataceae bacterium]|nr:RNA polymerase sigma factor [Gemmataceae bacterium]MCI0741390.1 RNA polymerase sigma factor [Gemmataceae bacterium]